MPMFVGGLGSTLPGQFGTVLRPFLQPKSPLSSQEFGLQVQEQAPGFELKTPILGVELLIP